MRRPLLRALAVGLGILSGLSCRADDPSALEVGEDGQVVPAANAPEADDYILDLAGAASITLSGTAITVSGEGVAVDGTTARITRAGTYRVQGTLADGQIKIDAEATAKVKLILAGVDITTSDDAVNASSGNGGGPGGAPPGMETGTNTFTMRGGYIYANANGDGLDINGPVEMGGGTIVLDGPTANDNGALDYTGSFHLTSGYLLAVGSAGMAQAPSTSSTQNSVAVRFASVQSAGILVHLADAAGGDVLTFRPAKRYQLVVFSSPALVRGSGYSLWVGGSSSGSERDGLFSGGAYLGGTRKATFDVTGVVTTVNAP